MIVGYFTECNWNVITRPCLNNFNGFKIYRLMSRYISQNSGCAWWRHQMETFSALLAICAGNSLAPVNFPHKGQWRGALMFALICVWINAWVNNRKAGDLRRYCAHYDVIVMGYLSMPRLQFCEWCEQSINVSEYNSYHTETERCWII